MKLPLMAAIAALSLYGCASHSANTREASSPEAGAVGGSGTAGPPSASPDAQDSEATGGSGSANEAAQPQDGQKWDVQQNTPTDLDAPQSPAGAVNPDRDVREDDGTGGSGDVSIDGKRDVADEPGALDNGVDDSRSDSQVDTDATPTPAN